MIILIRPIKAECAEDKSKNGKVNVLKKTYDFIMDCEYVSGYLCDPDNALSEFETTKMSLLMQPNGKIKKENGNVAYHLIQSFPKDLEISDDEVHQCGLELCKKINAHQAVICTHYHPLKNKFGDIYCECKHNHILLNAYIHPDKLDPNNPKIIKYHDSKRTYAQLRVWNDEIAIEHGLPIIHNPKDASY